MNKTFEEAINFRHACKSFDTNKKISKEDMSFILNAGIKSPTSFGLELTKFIVIENQELKDKIKKESMNQKQVSECSHLLLVLVRINDSKIESGTPKKRFERLGLSSDILDIFLNMYTEFTKTHLISLKDIYNWTSKQAYLAVGNIMTAAAVKGIDSCPLEGFEKEKIEKLLNLDKTELQLALVLPLGYRTKSPRKSVRLSFDEMVDFI